MNIKDTEQIKNFHIWINDLHHTVKFDGKFNAHSLSFLDTLVFKYSAGTLASKTYHKPTD